MAPVQFHFKVFILAVGAHQSGGNTGGYDQSVAHAESGGRETDRCPTRKVTPIKHRRPAILGLSSGSGDGPEVDEGENRSQFNHEHAARGAKYIAFHKAFHWYGICISAVYIAIQPSRQLPFAAINPFPQAVLNPQDPECVERPAYFELAVLC